MARKRSWELGDLIEAVKKSSSKRAVLKKIGLKPTGGNYKQLEKYIREYDIDTAHFLGQGWNVGLKFRPKLQKPLSEILVADSDFQSHKLKKRLLREGVKQARCECCEWAERSKDGRVPLEINHKNGDSRDNRIENLEILCPNCHSLRPHYRGSKLKK